MKRKLLIKIGLTGILLTLSFNFLFAGLGNYALWDDEANTALFARSVWETGDTSAMVDHNIIAFRSGSELSNLKNRYMPPASYYFAAPFAGLTDPTAFSARIPFAICGFFTVLLIAWWLWREQADVQTWVLVSLGILGNVSFFLYNRQARYYGLAIFLTVLLTYLYSNLSRHRNMIWGLSLVSVALFATNYLTWAACFAAGILDYLVWERKYCRIPVAELASALIPSVLVGGIIFYVWNPLGMGVVPDDSTPWLLGKLTLTWWNIRDLNAAEFGVGILIFFIPLLHFFSARDEKMFRGFTALIVYLIVVTLASPQAISETVYADIRHLAPVIPLCIWLTSKALKEISFNRLWISIPLAILAFGTNTLHGGFLRPLGLRSTALEFSKEIVRTQETSYSAVSAWINQNVEEGDSVMTFPGRTTYPLMFHAPKAVYAWQLRYPPQKQFEGLPDIHFRGVAPPDYIIIFGPAVTSMRMTLREWKKKNWHYDYVAFIDVFWRDLTRPELFWRTFTPVTLFNKETEAVYIFRLKKK